MHQQDIDKETKHCPKCYELLSLCTCHLEEKKCQVLSCPGRNNCEEMGHFDIPNKEEDYVGYCPHGAKDGECPVEDCANNVYDIGSGGAIKNRPIIDSVSPSDKTWEERFEEKWKEVNSWGGNELGGWEENIGFVPEKDGFKSFIQDLLTSATIKAKAEAIEKAVSVASVVFTNVIPEDLELFESKLRDSLEEPKS